TETTIRVARETVSYFVEERGGAPAGLPSAEEHSLIRQFRLLVLEGPDAGAQFASAGERTGIGTHRSADVQLTDHNVSRFHCEITIAGGYAVLQDLHSRNGTCLNGIEIERARLRKGAVVRLGTSKLAFELGYDQLRIPLARREEFGLLVGK